METSECFQQLIAKLKNEIEPRNPLSEESSETLYALAYGFYKNGKYVEASNTFRVLTAADASCRKHWVGLAASLQMAKEYEEAIEVYGVAVLLDENEPYAHFHAAECFFLLGNVKQALLTLESAELCSKSHTEHQTLTPHLALMRERWAKI